MCKIDDKKSRGTHRVTLFIDRNTTGYFDSFEIEYIVQNVLSKVKDKSVIKTLFRIQDNDSILGGFYCIAFTEYILVGKNLLDYTNLFSPADY